MASGTGGEGAAASSGCVGGDGVMEGMAVVAPGVTLSNEEFNVKTASERSSTCTTTLLSIDTRLWGEGRVSERFFTGEEVPDTVRSRSLAEWRLPEDENASADAAPSRRGREGVVEEAPAFWRSAMAVWSTEGDEGGVDMMAF